jgi:membrane-bound lytic murein transglycosylase D
MPLDLVCLAMIESGSDPPAHSRAHASGIWQFISETGDRSMVVRVPASSGGVAD